jgi:hypothetical protein
VVSVLDVTQGHTADCLGKPKEVLQTDEEGFSLVFFGRALRDRKALFRTAGILGVEYMKDC